MSMHSWGTAIDFNTDIHALGSARTDMPPEFVKIMEDLGFRWGGRWKGRPDPMHFEFKPPAKEAATQEMVRSAAAQPYLTYARSRQADIDGSRPQSPPAESVAQAPTSAPSTQTGGGEAVSLDPKRRVALDKVAQRIESATGRWLPLIRQSCEKYGIPQYVKLIQAIMTLESGGRPNVVGRNRNGTVDRGLMQLNSAYFNPPNVMDPAVNIDVGVKNLAVLIQKCRGNVIDIAASYNCGHAEGQSKGNGRGQWGIPSTTKNIYVPTVLQSLRALGYDNIPETGNYSNTRYA